VCFLFRVGNFNSLNCKEFEWRDPEQVSRVENRKNEIKEAGWLERVETDTSGKRRRLHDRMCAGTAEKKTGEDRDKHPAWFVLGIASAHFRSQLPMRNINLLRCRNRLAQFVGESAAGWCGHGLPWFARGRTLGSTLVSAC